ncbi:hypothetical protein BDR22DRAFT_818221 [Usnea florida]
MAQKSLSEIESFSKMNLTSSYGAFSKLPGELRIMVWNNVLGSETDVDNASQFMMTRQHLMVATCPSVRDIDAAILRTSRAIYEETFPILYGNNRFVFSAPTQISTFAFGELCRLSAVRYGTSERGYSFDSYGRLLMLRSVNLKLNASDRSVSCRHPNHKLDKQEAIWSYWAEIFCQPREHQSPIFPMLEELCLDFSDWGLDASDWSKLRLEPILRKLRPFGGLERLSIVSVKHEQNLIDFKHGFLKEGGTFMASDHRKNIITQGTKSLKDLPAVSKGVRDILQRERASSSNG